MLVNLVVSVAEAVTIVFDRRRRHTRIAESWVPSRIGSNSAGDIVPSSLDAVMEALTRNLGPTGGRRRRVIRDRAWMRTSS